MHCARNTLALHSTPVGPSPGPSPVGRGVICEVTPIGLLVSCVESLIFHAGNFYLSQNSQIEQTSLRTVSNSQKASGIQISQSVSAIVDAEQGATRSLHPAHRGISVITPLPLGEGKGEGPLLALNAVCSVHLCLSVRKRIIVRLAGEVFSLTERTEFTEVFGTRFELTERLRHTEFTEASPPAPLRVERGVVCEVTPISLLMIEDGLLNIWKTCRGISVITPLSIRRGAGGEASVWGDVYERGELV